MLIVNDKSQVEARPVVASQAIGDKWLISEGLKSGDQVIVSGLQKARPGEQVKATTDTPADTASKYGNLTWQTFLFDDRYLHGCWPLF